MQKITVLTDYEKHVNKNRAIHAVHTSRLEMVMRIAIGQIWIGTDALYYSDPDMMYYHAETLAHNAFLFQPNLRDDVTK